MAIPKKPAQKKVSTSIQAKKRQSTTIARKPKVSQSLQQMTTGPGRVSTGDILTLQRSLGNAATSQLIQRRRTRKPVNPNTLLRSPNKQSQSSSTSDLSPQPQGQELDIQRARPGVQRRMFDTSKTQREGAHEILSALKDSNWGEAIGKYKEDSVVYNKAAFLGGAGWVKWFRGVSGDLNTARKNAKTLLANKGTTKAEKHIKELTKVAGDAHTAVTNTSHFWGTNHQHSAAMARKIVYYLVNSLPDNLLVSGIQDHMQKGVEEEQQDPKAILMVGGSGSGKSTIIKTLNIDTSNMVVADADEVKKLMPKYSQGVHEGDTGIAKKVHTESNEITAGLINQAIATKKHLLYDATGANRGTYIGGHAKTMFGNDGLVKKLNDAGYEIKLIMAHIPTFEGLRRVKERGEQTGRHIPENVVKNIYRDAPKNFVEFSQRQEVNEATVYDTMSQPPVPIWNKGDGLLPLKFALGHVDDDLKYGYEEKIRKTQKWSALDKQIEQKKRLHKDFDPETLLNGRNLDEMEQGTYKYLSESGSRFADKAKDWKSNQDSPQAKLMKQYGLSVGEAAAIGIYTANDFKYMNPVMAGNDNWLDFQMKGVVPASAKYQKLYTQEKGTGFTLNTISALKDEATEHNLMLMSALKKLPNWTGKAYRGAGFTENEISQKFPNNGIATMEAFTSTSLKEGTSRSFANQNTDETRNKIGVFMDMDVTRGKDVATFSNTASESEVLVLPFAQFNVKEIKSIMEPNTNKEKYRHIILQQIS